MIDETLRKIEEKVRQAPRATEQTKEELLRLLEDMRSELDELQQTHTEQAESIAGFTQVAAHEATREGANQDLAYHAVEGLSKSVLEFEVSHPRLTTLVRSICTALSNAGI